MGKHTLGPNPREMITPLPRLTLNPPIPVQQINGESVAKFFGYAVNLTREGIFIPTLNPKPVGFKTRVRFEIPKKKIVVEGEIEVIWRREFDSRQSESASGMGIRFTNLTDEVKKIIDQYIQSFYVT